MEFLLVIHLLICAAMIAVVLLQKSEGGALGIGGGGGGGGFLTGRGTANLLTRVTAGLAAAFFATSLALTGLATVSRAPTTPISSSSGAQPGSATTPPGSKKPAGSLLEKLKGGQARQPLPSIPQNK